MKIFIIFILVAYFLSGLLAMYAARKMKRLKLVDYVGFGIIGPFALLGILFIKQNMDRLKSGYCSRSNLLPNR